MFITGYTKCAQSQLASRLAAKAVEGASLALEGVDDIHGSDGLAASVLGVGDGLTNDVLEEHPKDRAGLLVDEARDTLHTTLASETADSGLGNSLDVVTKDLPVTLGAALAKTLAALAKTLTPGGNDRTLSTSGHFSLIVSDYKLDVLCWKLLIYCAFFAR